MNGAEPVFLPDNSVLGQQAGRFGTPDAHAQAGPTGYLLPDREPPPWNPEVELYRRWKRRPRCDGEGEEG